MKNTLSSKDFNGRDIEAGMRITIGNKEKIGKKEGLIVYEGDIKIVGGNFTFKQGDIAVITKTQLVKQAGADKLRNEVTFQVEREGNILEEDGKPVEYVFMGTLLIQHLFPKNVSNIAQVLTDARKKVKSEVIAISELEDKK